MASGADASTDGNGAPLDTTVCVFAWNEAKSIEGFVLDVVQELEALGKPYEVLIIDDGSNDGTERTADELAAGNARVRVIHHAENLGLGGVYRTGLDAARGTFLSFFPADGQFPPSILADLRRNVEDRDLVLGYLPRRQDSVGKALSAIERALYRVVIGKMPRFQGVFMLRRSVLQAIPLRSTGRGWGIVMEMILRVHRAGYRIVSIPTTVRPRAHGESKVNNVRNIRANVAQLLTLRGTLRRS